MLQKVIVSGQEILEYGKFQSLVSQVVERLQCHPGNTGPIIAIKQNWVSLINQLRSYFP